jgi:hypothetical protein
VVVRCECPESLVDTIDHNQRRRFVQCTVGDGLDVITREDSEVRTGEPRDRPIAAFDHPAGGGGLAVAGRPEQHERGAGVGIVHVRDHALQVSRDGGAERVEGHGWCRVLRGDGLAEIASRDGRWMICDGRSRARRPHGPSGHCAES